MKRQRIKFQDNKYFLNDYQWFVFDREQGQKKLKNIAFPILVMDTEFFNQSHNKLNYEKTLFNDNDKSIVYVVQYFLANNWKEVYNQTNQKNIRSWKIQRRFNDLKYNFDRQYQALVNKFLHLCITKKIKTIVLAGASNDKEIIKNWVNQHRKILNNHQVDLFSLNAANKYDINFFDVYDLLGTTMSFSNFKKDGSEFYNQKNLKAGFFANNTIQIPSLKKFFDYFSDFYNLDEFEDNDDIYQLCVSALNFYSAPEMEPKDFIQWNKDVKKAVTHCFNDVLKLLYLLKFWYALVHLPNNRALEMETEGLWKIV